MSLANAQAFKKDVTKEKGKDTFSTAYKIT